MSGNERSNTLLKDSFSPQGENVNISHVYVGCTINEGISDTQPNTGVVENPEDRHCSENSELQNKIESTLKLRYTEITLPSLPWLETFDIPIEKYTTLQLESENDKDMSKIIYLENLFDNINEQTRKRILIESQPGFGKTTLAHKIVSDWSRGSEYVKHFKFAVLIILREYEATSLKEELKDIIGIENYDEVDFWKVINTDETLLIFDGLDEISGLLRQDIQEILQDNKEEYKMTIITTSRLGLSGLDRKGIRSAHHGVSLKKDIWNKKITILGINVVNQREFIEKFVDGNDKRILMPRLSQIIDSRKEMFNSPLLLILLVYVTSENHDVKIDTDTDLYKALVDCIIRRSVDKNNPEILSVDFTLFVSHYNVPIFDDYKDRFIRFGEICLDHILEDNLLFRSDAENEAIHQLGFLMKHTTKKLFGSIVRYEAFHLSILEFAAAVYVTHYFSANNNRFRPEDIDKLFKIVLKKKMASMLLPFLCDLLGKGIAHLIEELGRYYIFFWFNAEIVEFLFRKCLVNNVGKEHFVKIIPPFITVSIPSVRFNFVNTQYLAKFLVIKLTKVRYLRNICHRTHVRGLVCNGIDDNFEDVEDVLDIARNITCESLSFTIKNHLPYKNMAMGLKIFHQISSDCKNLHFRRMSRNPSIKSTGLEICVNSGTLVGEKLKNVIIELGNVKKEVLAKLIQCNRIENLVLVQDESLKDSTKNLAATVSHLVTTPNYVKTLFVSCRELCLGWDDFSKSGEKCLKKSNYANLEDTASSTDSDTVDRNARAIFPVKPSRLYCSCWESESLKNWENWDMIVELKLTDVTGSSRTYLPDFSKFKSLKILTLIINYRSKLDEASVENIVGSIKGLNLTRLTIKWYSSYHFFYGSIIDGVRELLQNKAIFCSESIRFEVTPVEVRSELFDFEIIRSALLIDSKIVFCITSDKWYDLQKIVMDRVNDMLFYNIKYSYTPFAIDINPLNFVPNCFYCGPDVQHMLELTLG